MVKVELIRIIIDEKKQEQIIVLKESSGTRMLPIVVGIAEAVAIRMHLNATRSVRPLTHDLVFDILKSIDVVLDKVIIDDLINNTFYAKLHISTPEDGVKVIDARPSDSVALAVRFDAPIFVADSVFGRLTHMI
jgi:hypothetical protein